MERPKIASQEKNHRGEGMFAAPVSKKHNVDWELVIVIP